MLVRCLLYLGIMPIRTTTIALAAALACVAPTMAFATPPAAAEHQPRQHRDAPAAATRADASRYATREAKDNDVAKYEGGRLIVIGVSTGALIVGLIILLLVI